MSPPGPFVLSGTRSASHGIEEGSVLRQVGRRVLTSPLPSPQVYRGRTTTYGSTR